MQWGKGGLPVENPRPHFADRVLIVGATWGALAVVALWVSPLPAMLLSLIPLGLGIRSALRAQASGKQESFEHVLRRQVSAVALMMAGSIFAATVWVLRDRVPLWLIPFEVGMLLHYWLLTLS